LLSNRRLICRPVIAVGNSQSFIAFLPNESFIARRVSGRAGPYQHLLQYQQHPQINARRTHHHLGTRDSIEHPACYGDDGACRPFHLHELPACSLLYAPNKNLAPKIGMPSVMDFQFLTRHGQNERVMALGRKSWLFAGSDRGGQRAAAMYSLMVTARLNDIDPRAWLADVLGRIGDHPASRLDELLPWNWRTFNARAA
jgi:hypothetical protein